MMVEVELWAALLGAIIGAVVGGVISWLIQLDSRRSDRAQKAADRLERQQGLAFSALYKLIAIASHYANYNRHLEESYSAATQDSGVDEPWQFVIPLGDVPSPIEFTAEEVTLFLSLQMNDVFNSLLTLADAHNQMGRLAELYRVKREALTELLPISAFAENNLQSNVAQEQQNRARPLMIELNHIAEAMRTFSARDAAESLAVMNAAQAGLREKLKLPITLETPT